MPAVAQAGLIWLLFHCVWRGRVGEAGMQCTGVGSLNRMSLGHQLSPKQPQSRPWVGDMKETTVRPATVMKHHWAHTLCRCGLCEDGGFRACVKCSLIPCSLWGVKTSDCSRKVIGYYSKGLDFIHASSMPWIESKARYWKESDIITHFLNLWILLKRVMFMVLMANFSGPIFTEQSGTSSCSFTIFRNTGSSIKHNFLPPVLRESFAEV